MAELFRQKNLERMKSPEQLDDYIRVSNPAAWMVLAGVILFLAGLIIWAAFGTIEDGGTVYHPIALLFGME